MSDIRKTNEEKISELESQVLKLTQQLDLLGNLLYRGFGIVCTSDDQQTRRGIGQIRKNLENNFIQLRNPHEKSS